MRTRKKTLDCFVYALYNGDDFIALGSLTELSAITNYDRKYLRWLTYPSAKGRNLAIIKVEDD